MSILPVLKEIISTERDYCHNVRTYLEVFLRPLKLLTSKGIGPGLTLEEVTALECNMEQVLSLGRELLHELERVGHTETRPPIPHFTHKRTFVCVGQVFSEYAERLRLTYVKYVGMYPEAYALSIRLTIERNIRKGASQSFAAFLSETHEKQIRRTRNRKLSDFLIIPIQRIPRYRLLLIELWRKLPVSLERDWTKEAILRVSAVATEMNKTLFDVSSDRKLSRKKGLESGKSLKEKKTFEEEGNDELEGEITDEEEEVYQNVNRILFRPRDPSVFLVDDIDQQDAIDGDLETKEDELDRLCLRRGWKPSLKRNLPTTNPFVLYEMLTRENPFDRKDEVEFKMNSHHISMRILRTLYCPSQPAYPFRPKKNDIIVCGPIRSGQTPILCIIESFRSRNIVPVSSLLDRVNWLEADIPFHKSFTGMSSAVLESGRLIKTHAQLNIPFGGVVLPEKLVTTNYKIIITLRNPADLRLSFFRHCRRLYRKLQPKANDFDVLCKVDDFVSAFPFYEAFIADALHVEEVSQNILIVFHEELLNNPNSVIQKIVKFIERGSDEKKDDEDEKDDIEKLTEDISRQIQNSFEFPSQDIGKKTGSSNAGTKKFSRASLERFEMSWEKNVGQAFRVYPSYEVMYTKFTESPYPFVPVGASRPVFDQRARQSTATAGTSASLKKGKRRFHGGSLASVLAPRHKFSSSLGLQTEKKLPFARFRGASLLMMKSDQISVIGAENNSRTTTETSNNEGTNAPGNRLSLVNSVAIDPDDSDSDAPPSPILRNGKGSPILSKKSYWGKNVIVSI